MLKKYIRSVLESYRGSHKSVFDINKAISVGNGTIYDFLFTAPADGWMYLAGNATACHISPLQHGLQSVSSEANSGMSWCAACVRVRKGSQYKMWAHGCTNAVAMFYPDVGS